MSDIFISYTRSDIEKAKTLAEVLEQQGWSVWWDRKIPPGKSFNKVIEEALGAAKCVVVLWSKDSVNSNWVKDEASEGLQREILVPVLIDDVVVPLGFRQIQAARLVGWQGKVTDEEANQLIESIASFIGHHKVEKQKPVSKPIPVVEPIVDKHEKTKPPETLTKEANTLPISKPQFRSTTEENLSGKSVKSMLKRYNFYCKEESWSEEYCNPNGKGFHHKFKDEVINGDKVIIDQASGLTWQQSGSGEYMNYDKAREYVNQSNRERFAGYSDWRLPTLEEAMSLMETKQKNGDLYIDPVFDKKQKWIWTSDLFSASRVWVVGFINGYCNYYDIGPNCYVRAVR